MEERGVLVEVNVKDGIVQQVVQDLVGHREDQEVQEPYLRDQLVPGHPGYVSQVIDEVGGDRFFVNSVDTSLLMLIVLEELTTRVNGCRKVLQAQGWSSRSLWAPFAVDRHDVTCC